VIVREGTRSNILLASATVVDANIGTFVDMQEGLGHDLAHRTALLPRCRASVAQRAFALPRVLVVAKIGGDIGYHPSRQIIDLILEHFKLLHSRGILRCHPHKLPGQTFQMLDDFVQVCDAEVHLIARRVFDPHSGLAKGDLRRTRAAHHVPRRIHRHLHIPYEMCILPRGHHTHFLAVSVRGHCRKASNWRTQASGNIDVAQQTVRIGTDDHVDSAQSPREVFVVVVPNVGQKHHRVHTCRLQCIDLGLCCLCLIRQRRA